MSGRPKHERVALYRAVEQLRAQKEELGFLLPEHIRACAKANHYSAKQVRRALHDAEAAQPSTDNDTGDEDRVGYLERVINAVFLMCGNLAAARRLLQRQGVTVPSQSTFRRYAVKEIGTDHIAYARGGSKKFRNAQLYLRARYPHRMHSVLLDHTEGSLLVVPRGHKHAVKPWLTVVMDGYSRYILSWVVTFGRPSTDEVRAALMQAFMMRLAPDGKTIVGGLPVRAVWDRGLEFLSTLITESCLRLGVTPYALPPYTPHWKGRLERFWEFLKQDLLPPLPGYCEGPRDLRGNSALENHALGEDEFLLRLADWMDDYLMHHVNASTGMTALQAWNADATPLQEVGEEQLWQDFLLAKDRCKVSKNGIRWDGIDWTAPELQPYIGRHVEIRHLMHDRSFIEVFSDNDHVCTAHPVDHLSEAEEQQFVDYRKNARRQAMARFTRANRLRRDGHDEVHKLAKDKDGRRNVVPPDDDLLAGGEEALRKLFDTKRDNTKRDDTKRDNGDKPNKPDKPDEPDDQTRLF